MFRNEPLLLLSYSVLVLLASLAGGLVPLKLRLSHARMELALSAVAGFMLGVAFLHLLPHAVEAHGSAHDLWIPGWVMAGLVATFLVGRFLSTHQHEAHGHASGGHEAGGHGAGAAPAAPASWIGAFAGFGMHTIVGGVALAASVQAEARATLLPGLAMFTAIVLHKPMDAMALTTLVRAAGGGPRRLRAVNIVFGTLTGVGAILFVVLGDALSGEAGVAALLGPALAFSAGTFLCIALSDLLPELRFHSHDRWTLTAALLGGLLLAAALAGLETAEHDHAGHASSPVSCATAGDGCPWQLMA